MAGFEQTQEAILAYLETELAQPVHEVAIPDGVTVLKTDGRVENYFAIQFGDLQQGMAKNMATPRGDDYLMPVYIQAVSGSAAIARKMSNRVIDLLLGMDFGNSGSIRKRPGGGMFPVIGSNMATEAYLFPSSFSVLVQMREM